MLSGTLSRRASASSTIWTADLDRPEVEAVDDDDDEIFLSLVGVDDDVFRGEGSSREASSSVDEDIREAAAAAAAAAASLCRSTSLEYLLGDPDAFSISLEYLLVGESTTSEVDRQRDSASAAAASRISLENLRGESAVAFSEVCRQFDSDDRARPARRGFGRKDQ